MQSIKTAFASLLRSFWFVCDHGPRAEARGYYDAAAPQPIARRPIEQCGLRRMRSQPSEARDVLCASLRSSGVLIACGFSHRSRAPKHPKLRSSDVSGRTCDVASTIPILTAMINNPPRFECHDPNLGPRFTSLLRSLSSSGIADLALKPAEARGYQDAAAPQPIAL